MRLRAPLFLFAAVVLLASGCAPGHRLAEVDLPERSVAVMAPIPPTPRIVEGPWPMVRQAVRPPPGEVRRRYDASRAAQGRLDRAAGTVDPAEVLARRSLIESARLLRVVPENDPDEAELILDVRLLQFRFTAAGFDSAVRSFVEVEARLSRAATGELLWERRFRERDAVDPQLFGAPEFGRRLSARDMTRLSTDHLAYGIESIALRTADRIARRLYDEYRVAHR